MRGRSLFLILVGLGGTAILLALGIWQTQRLEWKQGVIAEIEARIDATPQALPAKPDPDTDAYLPVEVSGMLEEPSALYVLVSDKVRGPGYRVIVPFTTAENRRVMADLGFAATPIKGKLPNLGAATLIGNLQWPQEVDGFTPEPDLERNIWFARDVPAMAAALNAEPVLVVARTETSGALVLMPMPVDTSRIPNNHLQYAITWFSLAAIWLAMSLYFVRRRKS